MRAPGIGLRPLLTHVEKPFDQTNGTIHYDEAVPREVSRASARLMATGVAANLVAVGFFGGM